jgi:TPR repeat protein
MLAAFALVLALVQSPGSGAVAQSSFAQETMSPVKLSSSDVAQIQSKAEASDASAQLALGRAYQDGNGVPQNEGLAAKWYRRAADQGNAAAQNNLGIMYRAGSGVEKNKEEAVNWYRKAVRQDYASAMFNLGTAYYNGDGLPSDTFRAYDWFLLAQEAGSSSAAEAVKRTSGEIGQSASNDALLEVGQMREKGDEVPQNLAEAAKWYRRSADQKNPRAMLKLASLLVNGVGVSKDYDQAFQLCHSAAKDYAPAQYCVGFLYQRGLGVQQDTAEAAKWYQKSAARGHTPAYLALGQMYRKGEGVKADLVASYLRFFQAYAEGQKSAKSLGSSVLSEMTSNDTKRLDKKLRERNLDPGKVRAVMETGTTAPSPTAQ